MKPPTRHQLEYAGEAPDFRIHPTYYTWKAPHNDPLDQG